MCLFCLVVVVNRGRRAQGFSWSRGAIKARGFAVPRTHPCAAARCPEAAEFDKKGQFTHGRPSSTKKIVGIALVYLHRAPSEAGGLFTHGRTAPATDRLKAEVSQPAESPALQPISSNHRQPTNQRFRHGGGPSYLHRCLPHTNPHQIFTNTRHRPWTPDEWPRRSLTQY